MDKKYKYIAYAWLTVISIISLAALCRSFAADRALDVDYSGILVGILTALCTVLIGWQIYTLINLKEIDKRVKHAEADMERHYWNLIFQVYGNISILNTQLATKSSQTELYFQSIHWELSQILALSHLGKFNECDAKIQFLLDHDNSKISIDLETKDLFRDILEDVKNKNQIKLYRNLRNWIEGYESAQ